MASTGVVDDAIVENGGVDGGDCDDECSGDDCEDDASVESIHQDHGTYGNNNGDDDDYDDCMQDVPWNGCVCGQIHARPTPVFWIQCDGPCQAWYNVTSSCVNSLTANEAATLLVWNCNDCTALLKRTTCHSPSLQLFLDLPAEVFFRILKFAAQPTHRAAVLQTQIAPMCKVTRHFVQGSKSRGIWQAILEQDYYRHSSQNNPTTRTTVNHAKIRSPQKRSPCAAAASPNEQQQRASKRRRKGTNFFFNTNSGSGSSSSPVALQKTGNNGARQSVIREHLSLLSRNEDAYIAVAALADPMSSRTVISRRRDGQNNIASDSSQLKKNAHVPLTLQRLRRLVQSFDHHHAVPLDVNRPCPFSGRTFLHICCAAELNEAGVVQCVRYLIQQHGADPNVLSTNEAPFANRPALFFAISRIMPKLVDLLIKSGASLTVQTHGEFRRTFDTTKTISGCFTPLEYALEIKRVEGQAQQASSAIAPSASTIDSTTTAAAPHVRSSGLVPPYWMNKLNRCIRILAEAASSSS